jgi:LuxR family transcriptional regulator, maltose regulon positive regulatory protein
MGFERRNDCGRVAAIDLRAFFESLLMSDGADGGETEEQGLHSYKLYAPPLRPDLIGRTSIVDRVFGAESSPVVLLQAPAGYGKSTTLRQIMNACEERGFLTAWLTFDEADNDPRRFLVHFQALLASVPTKNAQSVAEGIDAGGRGYRSDWATPSISRRSAYRTDGIFPGRSRPA